MDRTLKGEWSLEELAQFLEQIAALLLAKGEDIRLFIRETGYRQDNPVEVDSGLSGLELYEAGMEEMFRYLEDRDPAHLLRGLEQIWEGNERINQAMEINRESREDLDVEFFM